MFLLHREPLGWASNVARCRSASGVGILHHASVVRFALLGSLLMGCPDDQVERGGATDGASSSSAVVTGSSSTGAASFCGGEPLGESAWCHTPADFDISPMDVRRIHAHVAPNDDGTTSLLLAGLDGPVLPGLVRPDLMQEFVLDGSEPSGYRLTGFSIGGVTTSTSRLTPVQIYADASGRHDYLGQEVKASCQSSPVVASPARAAAYRPLGPSTPTPSYGFDRCIRTLFSPIRLRGESVDAFFYACDGEYCLSIDPEPPSEWFVDRLRMPAVQRFPGLGCTALDDGPVDIVVGRFHDPYVDEIVLLPRVCEGHSMDALWTVEDVGGGRVGWGREASLGAFSERGVAVLKVADLNQDGFDDLLLIGDQVLASMYGGPGGLSEPEGLAPLPFVLPYFDSEMVEDSALYRYPPNVRVGAGQFDDTPELELVVRVESGVLLASLDGTRSLELDELASDFAVGDVDGDGVDDLALLFEAEDAVRIYLSDSNSG